MRNQSTQTYTTQNRWASWRISVRPVLRCNRF